MKCGNNLATDLVDGRIKMAEDNIGKEIILSDIGQRNSSTGCHQNDLKQIGSIETIDTCVRMSTCTMIPSVYRKESYPSNNRCVWVSTCLAVCSFGTTQAENIILMFRNNQTKFEWLTLFNEHRKKCTIALFDTLIHTQGMDLDLCKVELYRDYKISTMTEYIFEEKGWYFNMCIRR